MAYQPAGQGGATPSDNPFSLPTDTTFPVVVSHSGGRVRTGEAVLDSRPGPGDPNRPRTSPAEALMRGFVGMSSTEIAAMQRRLIAAGYLPKGSASGVADNATRNAYTNLLIDTMVTNRGGDDATPDDILTRSSQNLLTGGAGSGAGANVVEVSDTASVREAAHAAFKAVTGKGRAVDDKKVGEFVAAFTAAQVGAQRSTRQAQDAAAASGGSPEIQQTMPDLGARALEFAATADPEGAGAHKVAEKFDMFLKLLGGIV